MAKTIILTEEQLGKVTRVDEGFKDWLGKAKEFAKDAKNFATDTVDAASIPGGFVDKVRASSQDAKRGYQDDKARNRRIRELRDFATDLYVISGEKNGTISRELYKAVRMAISKRIWQIQDIIRIHGLDYDGTAQRRGKKQNRDFTQTQEGLKEWKDYFTKKGQYNESYLGRDLYNAFESCLKMPLAYERQFFFTIDKKINPLMADLSRRTGDFQYAN